MRRLLEKRGEHHLKGTSWRVRDVKEGSGGGDCEFGSQPQSEEVQLLSELETSNSLSNGASPVKY